MPCIGFLSQVMKDAGVLADAATRQECGKNFTSSGTCEVKSTSFVVRFDKINRQVHEVLSLILTYRRKLLR
eukprot:UN20122